MTLIQLVSTGVRLEAAEGDAPRRTLAGQAVPFNVIARVMSGERVMFLPGSLPLDGSAPKVLRNHDRTQPLGVVVNRTADAEGVNVSARISATSAGDEVLVLAADGVLDAWSVGAEPTDFSFERDNEGDFMVVAKADWQEISVLPFGAFPTAKVTSVAASTQEVAVTTTTEAPPTEVVAAPAPPPAVIPPTPTPTPVTVVQGAPGPRGSTIAAGSLSLHGVANLIASANRGEMTMDVAKTRIQAALANIKTTDIPSIVMPASLAEIVGIIDWGRPFINAISTAPLPASGMQIEYPHWATLPTVGEQVTEKTAITSTPAVMDMKQTGVHTFAGGNDISLQSMERSSPSFLEAYLRAMAADFAKKTDTYVVNALLAVATVVAPGVSFIDNVSKLVGSLNPATTPAGPLVLGLSWDVGAGLIGVTQQNGPAFWSGSVNFGAQLPSVNASGLNIFVDPNLPVKTYVLGLRNGATWYESPGAPADIRVVDVSLLGLDVGVYGFGALAITWPGSWLKMTTA